MMRAWERSGCERAPYHHLPRRTGVGSAATACARGAAHGRSGGGLPRRALLEQGARVAARLGRAAQLLPEMTEQRVQQPQPARVRAELRRDLPRDGAPALGVVRLA